MSITYQHQSFTIALAAAALLACAGQDRSDYVGPGGQPGAQDTTEAPEPESEDGGDGDDTRYDVADDESGDPDNESEGCDNVDFLFVIDNSGSMHDEQLNLVRSFPGFISTIQQTLQAQDYHVMVVDTDAGPPSGDTICDDGVCWCEPEPGCCFSSCNEPNASPTCGGIPCSDYVLPTGCDVELGGARAGDELFRDCGFTSGMRYMTDVEPDLVGAFECAAMVGIGGQHEELQMDALVRSVGPMTEPGECNDAFLRDDAILVVTIITDEEDDASTGDPAAWKQAVVDAKHGDESAVVVLGLLGDTDVPGGVCVPMGQYDGAEAAPRLRELVESFQHGAWASVCLPDYASFFEEIVGVIDLSCDSFVPPG